MTHMKKSLLSIALFVCGLLLWKPVQAEAATQVDNLVLMVNFSKDGDNTFQTNFSRYQEMYTGPESEPNRSLSQYISTISDGQVTVNTYFPQVVNNVFLPVTIQGSASDYPDASAGEQFVQQVITAAQNMSELSFPSKLDSMRGDGYIDNLTIIVQVDENNTSGAFGSRKADWGYNQTLLHGWHVGAYNVLPTNMLRLGSDFDQGYALASHEFLHTLGAPDLYRTAGENGYPVGRWWDLMAGANFTASYPLVYTRSKLGWMQIETLKDSGTYTLWPAEGESGSRAYILKTSRSDSEFFVVEYRKKPENRQDYDYYIPESGLIVYRVNNAVDYHTNKEGNNYIYVFRKDTKDPAKAQQDENEQWVDVAPVADLQQADPVLAGRNKMQELITQNREAVQNGTAGAEQISPLMAKQGILAGATLASASQVQSAVNKTAAQTAKPQTTGNNPLAVTTPAATPAPTQQPVINDNSDDDDDDDDSSDSGSSDSGSSDSGSSGDDTGGDTADSGDGEDIGWTDEVL